MVSLTGGNPVNSTVMLHEEIPVPPDPLTAEQEARVAQLSEADLDAIDNLLLSNAGSQWRKVAMVVAMTLHAGHDLPPGIPDKFYGLRIQKLVAQGRLEAQGDLQLMRFSEVRLPERSTGSEAT